MIISPELPDTERTQLYEGLLWLSQCTDIYMDLGSNIGVKIRKLFEPERYTVEDERQKPVMDLCNEKFGLPDMRKKNPGLCALGFEPNPVHYQRFKKPGTFV